MQDLHDAEDPIWTKYENGEGSVKGLHYMKHISLELISEKDFTICFHKFYSVEVKNIIKNLDDGVRYDPDLRKWIVQTQLYDIIMV